MKNNHTKNSIINIVVVIVMQVMNFFYALVSKKVFLKYFTISILGVESLFNTFFNSLGLMEMGFSTILVFNLYKPIATDDVKEIRRQLSMFKTIYFVIATIIFVSALFISPFVFKIFNIGYLDYKLIYEMYFLQVISIVVKFYLLNKISIIRSNQNKYIENGITAIMDLIGFVARMISVLIFQNIYMYMFAQIVTPALNYVFSAFWINRHYDVKNIPFATISEIKNSEIIVQCRKYVYANLYNLVYFSMDNIIISIALSTDAIAYVSNYLVIIKTAEMVINMVSISIRGIIADYYHNNCNCDDLYEVFDVVSSFNFILVSLVSVGLYTLIDDFILLWLGEEFVIVSKSIKLILILTMMMNSLFETIVSIFVIKGYIFKEKWPLIFSAITNFVLTISLIHPLGILGAYLGTMFADVIRFFGKLYYVLFDVFKKFKKNILIDYTTYLVVCLIEMLLFEKLNLVVFSGCTSFTLFIFKVLFISLFVIFVNGMLILRKRNIKKYVKETLIKNINFLERRNDEK